MDQITNALMMRDTAPRSHIAITYGIVGLLVGTLVLGGK